MPVLVKPVSILQKSLKVPGDKSISHRALLFASLAEGTSEIAGLAPGADVHSTLSCLHTLGVEVDFLSKTHLTVHGRGSYKGGRYFLDCGNSGTTMRLFMGILAAMPGVNCTLFGDASLSVRPMLRIAQPLNLMGANIQLKNGQYPPLDIRGGRLRSLLYELPLASAQLKSALLLAALTCKGKSVLAGEIHSRDHSERMLRFAGIQLLQEATRIEIDGPQTPKPFQLEVPGDPSSAAFWLCAAAILPGSVLRIESMALNPSRIQFLEVLKQMGARIQVELKGHGPEPSGDVTLEQRPLKGIQIPPHLVPLLIDELPIFGILFLFAEGRSSVSSAKELRVKECDRIAALCTNLQSLGLAVTEREDGFEIIGKQQVQGGKIKSYGDHRIAMAFAILGLASKEGVHIDDAECIGVSYPGFLEEIAKLPE